MTAAVLLAVDDSAATPGVLGFLVVAALGVATWLLLRSMRRQLRKIDFDEDGEPAGPARTEPATPDPARSERVQGQSVEGQPVEGRPVEGQSVEGQPGEGQPGEGQPVEGRPVERDRATGEAEPGPSAR
jgi:hypothetical protein